MEWFDFWTQLHCVSFWRVIKWLTEFIFDLPCNIYHNKSIKMHICSYCNKKEREEITHLLALEFNKSVYVAHPGVRTQSLAPVYPTHFSHLHIWKCSSGNGQNPSECSNDLHFIGFMLVDTNPLKCPDQHHTEPHMTLIPLFLLAKTNKQHILIPAVTFFGLNDTSSRLYQL